MGSTNGTAVADTKDGNTQREWQHKANKCCLLELIVLSRQALYLEMERHIRTLCFNSEVMCRDENWCAFCGSSAAASTANPKNT